MSWRIPWNEILAPWSGEERCGVWTSDGFYQLENRAVEPQSNFKMMAEDIETVPGTVVGIWHSHQDGKIEPSQTDVDFHPVGFKMAIVCGGLWREYDRDGEWLASYGPEREQSFGFGHTGDFLPERVAGTCVVCGDPGPRPMVFRLSEFCCGVCELVLAGELPPAAAAQARVTRRAERLGP